MQNGNGSVSKSTQDFVDGIIKANDLGQIESIRNIAVIIQSAARHAVVTYGQNQELQRWFARLCDRRSLPDEFLLLASGFASDLRLRNTVVKLYPLANDILARTEPAPSPRTASVHVHRPASEAPLPVQLTSQ